MEQERCGDPQQQDQRSGEGAVELESLRLGERQRMQEQQSLSTPL